VITTSVLSLSREILSQVISNVGLYYVCLKIDRNFTQARDALKRLQSSGQ
jgi:hypothetical protein